MAPESTPPALTLVELVATLPHLLAGGYEGVRSGRVRDLPDARTIRWYQTLGIVDPPLAFQGRAALYGRRHLLQLAAIKKVQASGFSLEEIQAGLAGRTDAELARTAGIGLRAVDAAIEEAAAARRMADDAALASALAGRPAPPATAAERSPVPFWKRRPAAVADTPPDAPTPIAVPIQSANLGGSVVLVWNGRPLSAAESARLAELSAPILALLSSSTRKDAPAEGAPKGSVAPRRRPEKGSRP